LHPQQDAFLIITHALMSWSGGKESALALHYALSDPACHVAHLLTSVNTDYERVSLHSHLW
jgi:diphthamide synthase (EF-2-diphthine--ammonia ligase)